MKRPSPPKKTEMLEVRLPHAIKLAFMARARAEGRTASAVIRRFIESYLADGIPAVISEARPMFKPFFRRFAKPIAATSVAASVLALYAAMSATVAVAAAPDLKAIFDDLDRNHDGMLSVAEFLDRNSESGRLKPVDSTFVRVETRIGDDPATQLGLVRKAGAVELPPDMTAEVQASMRRPFDAQDGDRSGSVSFDEFKRYHLAILRQGFNALDTDYSGAIERSEYDASSTGGAALRISFDEADRDRDGRIGWAEFLG